MTRITTTPATLAVNADYADALLTARRAKNWLFYLLTLILLAQLAVFFLVRYNVVQIGPQAATASATTSDVSVGSPTTQATAEVTTQPSGVTVRVPGLAVRASNNLLAAVLEYVSDLSVFLGVILGIVLLVAVILMTLIMLVGRMIGVTHVTSAVVWSALLMALLFPWQIFFNRGPDRAADAMVGAMSGTAGSTLAVPSSSSADAAAAPSRVPDFYIPGVLYTWDELARGAHFGQDPAAPAGRTPDLRVAILKWARFVGFPVLALIILFVVQGKTSRGARFALGEADVQVEVTTPTA